MQEEKEALRKKLEIENKRVKAMKDKARLLDGKDEEINTLQEEVTELQVYACARSILHSFKIGPCLGIQCPSSWSTFWLESKVIGREERYKST
jgi:hypothetical protein